MTRWIRSVPGVLVCTALIGAVLSVGVVGWRVYRVTHPARVVQPLGELTAELVKFEDVEFRASDGTELSGWLFEGRQGFPAVVLCHGLGEGKAANLNLAIELQTLGFTVLAFDFRGQGGSGGDGIGLGILEKRDVLGAVDFLAAGQTGDGLPRKLGVYGVGTGAHAAVLAAADRPEVRVMVLDGLYPDASYPLLDGVYAGWEFGQRHLAFVPEAVFVTMAKTPIRTTRAADVLPTLVGRDLLLVAPAGNTRLAEEIQRMYERIPEQKDADGNLVTLPTGGRGLLRGENLAIYHDRVTSFFSERLDAS